jgi:CRP/FNR family cyclic AMP-dependent transcriptional regulator
MRRRTPARHARAAVELVPPTAPLPMQVTTAPPQDLTRLVAAIKKTKGLDARELLDGVTWDALSHVLKAHSLPARECLIRQGDAGRSLYLIESGSATVYRAQERGRLQLAVLGPGSVVGEGTFFAKIVRSASVETLEPAQVWELATPAFDDLARGSPRAALQLCRFLGAVLATRMLSVTGRLSIT